MSETKKNENHAQEAASAVEPLVRRVFDIPDFERVTIRTEEVNITDNDGNLLEQKKNVEYTARATCLKRVDRNGILRRLFTHASMDFYNGKKWIWLEN